LLNGFNADKLTLLIKLDYRMNALVITKTEPAAARAANLRELASNLRAQSCEVLKVLIRASGETVSKEQLLQQVWGRRAVTDDSLVQCIKEIRQTLGDSKHQILQTVHRRGYRIMLEKCATKDPQLLPWLAVLPMCIDNIDPCALPCALMCSFRLLSGLGENLAGHPNFSVLSRFSMNSIKYERLTALQMSERLGAQYLLSGELRRAAHTFQWSFELIHARRDRVLWSNNGELVATATPEKIDSLACAIAHEIISPLMVSWKNECGREPLTET
jgi:DNA-binding winged helix-turn-helix (wHTH) protein/TolB-like protein